MPNEAAEQLKEYLQSTPPKQWERVVCCDSSRSLYCPECCKILIPRQDWPLSLQDGSLRLPFSVHVILDKKERRTASTGIQLTALYRSMIRSPSEADDGNEDAQDSNVAPNESELAPESDRPVLELQGSNSAETPAFSVELYDLERVEMPTYDPNTDTGTFVLFPQKGSVPVSSVASEIKTLVVLDMKWSSQTVKTNPSIAALPKVHLDSPPAESHFWRWHTSGQGMLSTIEAVYFAAMDATSTTWRPEEKERILDIMWLFALQYAVIYVRSEEEQRPLPFTEEGKDRNRALRKLQHGNPSKKRVEEEPFYKELS